MGLLDGSGRVGRLNYFATSLGLGLVTMFAFYALTGTDEMTGEPQISGWVVLVALGSTWFQFTNMIRRLHDIGRSGWSALLMLVPFIGTAFALYLLFAPGDSVRNLYGQPPGFDGPASADVHRQRMELLATAAGNAYRNRPSSAYLNDDGSFNMDGLETAGQSRGGQTATSPPPVAPPSANEGDLPAWSAPDASTAPSAPAPTAWAAPDVPAGHGASGPTAWAAPDVPVSQGAPEPTAWAAPAAPAGHGAPEPTAWAAPDGAGGHGAPEPTAWAAPAAPAGYGAPEPTGWAAPDGATAHSGPEQVAWVAPEVPSAGVSARPGGQSGGGQRAATAPAPPPEHRRRSDEQRRG